ncbi:competence protein CoiA [Metabacillus sp. 113a]|uniref:competence protein CoiA n=1 Tax=Metabacillus sp. 113a TaxID=3404706 RepID=UPI003CF7EB34
MLTALMNTKIFSLIRKTYTFEELDRLRSTHSFYCPACKQQMELKLGKIKRYHFAHRKKTACESYSEPETERHLAGKEDLYQWLEKEGEVQLEPFLPEIRQRPDLLFTMNGKRYAIEYQCSVIPREHVASRIRGYEKLNIQSIWILGSNQLKRLGPSEYRIPSFSWLFARHFPRSFTPYLLYYCPENKQLLRLNHLYPFSGQIFFAHAVSFRQGDSLKHILQNPPDEILPDRWLKSRLNRFRKRLPPKEMTAFQQMLYVKKRVPLALLPSIVFIPSCFDYCFETEPYLWKTSLLLWAEECISFTVQDAAEYLFQLERDGIAVRRQLSFANPSNQDVVEDLGSRLLKAGFLVFMENEKRYRIAPVIWTDRIERILDSDTEFFRLISGCRHNL